MGCYFWVWQMELEGKGTFARKAYTYLAAFLFRWGLSYVKGIRSSIDSVLEKLHP